MAKWKWKYNSCALYLIPTTLNSCTLYLIPTTLYLHSHDQNKNAGLLSNFFCKIGIGAWDWGLGLGPGIGDCDWGLGLGMGMGMEIYGICLSIIP